MAVCVLHIIVIRMPKHTCSLPASGPSTSATVDSPSRGCREWKRRIHIDASICQTKGPVFALQIMVQWDCAFAISSSFASLVFYLLKNYTFSLCSILYGRCWWWPHRVFMILLQMTIVNKQLYRRLPSVYMIVQPWRAAQVINLQITSCEGL